MPNPVLDALSFGANPPPAPGGGPPPPQFANNPVGEALSFGANPVQGYVKDRARAGGSFGEVADTLKGSGIDLGPQGEQYFNLESARGKQAGTDESPLEYAARRMPGGGSVGNAARDIRFGRVVEKYQRGEATKDDLDFLAHYERLKEIDAERESTVGGAALNKLSYAPQVVGEFYATKGIPLGALGRGAVGANVVRPAIQAQVMPSMTLDAAARRVAEQGGSITDAKNLAPAAVMSALNNIVLHNTGTAGQGLGLPGRVAAGTAAGVGGQQLADALGGAADEVLPDAYKTRTRYGLVGELARGETDDALKNAAAQVVMFAAFSALGGRRATDSLTGTEFYRPGAEPPEALPAGGQPPPGLPPKGPHPVYGAFADLVNDLSGRGYPRARVGAEAQKVGDWFAQQRDANPLLTRSEVLPRFEEQFKGQRESVLKFGRAVADAAFPEQVVQGFKANKPGEPPPEPSKPKVNVTTGFPGAEPAPPESLIQTALRQRLTDEGPQRALGAPNSRLALPPAEGRVEGEIAPQRRGQGLKLGEGVPLKAGMEMDPAEAHAVQKWGDGRVYRFPVHSADGEHVGTASVVEEDVGNGQVDIHVPWASGAKMAGGEGRGNHPFGAREVFAVARQIAELVPNARFLKYQASEGRIRAGQARVLDLDRFRPQPAEPQPPPGPPPVDEGRLAALRRNPERDAMLAMQGPVGPPLPPPPLTAMQLFMARGRQPALPGQPVVQRIQPGQPAPPRADVPRSPLLDQPEPPPPLTHESLRAMDPADRERLMAEKGLTPDERHVVHERLAGRSQGKIAKDAAMMEGRKKPLSRERIRQLEQSGLGKLDLAASVEKGVHEGDRADAALAAAEAGKRIVPGDLGVAPDEVLRRVKKRADPWVKYDAQLATIRDQFLKEMDDAKSAGREPDPAVIAALHARAVAVPRPGAARRPEPGQEPLPVRAPVPPQLPAQAAAAAGRAQTPPRRVSQKRLNLVGSGEGSTLDKAVLLSGGIDPRSESLLAHFSSAKEAVENGVPKVLFVSRAKGGRSLDELATELKGEGHLLGDQPQDLVDALMARHESANSGFTAKIEADAARHYEGPSAVDAFLNFDPKEIEAEAALHMAKFEAKQRAKAKLSKGGDVELKLSVPGARELYDYTVKALTWLAKYRGAVPRVPIRFDTQHILPRWGNYADWKAAHATPEGLGRIPVLARLFDPRGVAFEPVDRSIIARAAAVENGKTMAALWAATHKPDAGLWAAHADGTVMLAGNRRGFLGDVIEAELRRPGSQPLTPAQRQWVRGVYEPLLADLHDMLSAEGVKGWVDANGNPSPLSRFYFPRPAVGKAGYPAPSEAGAPPKGASSPGAKSFFQKARDFATEEEGHTQGGVRYDQDPVSRVAKMIAGAYRAVADHRLANDPDLGAMPAAAHVWLETRPVNVAPAFQGKVFPVEIARRLESAYGQARNPLIQMAESVAAAGKGLVLGLDYGVITNQMLPVLFRHPVLWGRATANGAKAMFDPFVMSKYLARPENATAASEFVQGGGTLGRLSDFAAGLEKGEFATRVPLVGKGYEVAGRMLGVAMDVSKLELWKAWRAVTPPPERAAMIEAIENMVGGGRMESIGQAPWWTLAQRMLFLAPSLYRSGLGLVATAFQRGAAGKFARQALGAYLAGMALLVYGALKALGLDDDEIAERFDPRTGKFLKVPIKLSDGSSVNVGFSHIFISFARLAGTIEKSFGDDNPIDTGADGNPVLRWYRGHAGTLPRIFIDLFTGKDYQGNRTGIGESAAKAVEPLAAQTLLHGDGSVFEKGVENPQGPKYANALDAAVSVLGLQAQPESAGAVYRHVLNDQAKTQFGKPYDQLTLQEQAQVVKAVKRADAAPKKPDPSPALIERAHAIQVERQRRMTAALDDDTRRKLSALGETVPGYEGTVHVLGTDVPLTKERQARLEALLVEEYQRSVALWPVEAWKELPPDLRKKAAKTSLEHAGQRARRRLLAGE